MKKSRKIYLIILASIFLFQNACIHQMQGRNYLANNGPAPIADTICFSRKEAEQIRLKVLDCANTKKNFEKMCNLELKQMQVVFGADLQVCKVQLQTSQKNTMLLSKQKNRMVLVVVFSTIGGLVAGGAIGYSIAYLTK